MRLILAPPSGPVDEVQLAEFKMLATSQTADDQGVWVAVQSDRVISAVMPLFSPGRTMLLFTPSVIRGQAHAEILRQVVEAACRSARDQGVHLAQVLLEPDAASQVMALRSSGFVPLAELLYMHALIARHLPPPPLAAGRRWVNYSEQAHELFARTILASYEQSFDGPALNGLRDIDDILAGHLATGQFNPANWFVLCQGDEPLAVLLTSELPRCDAVELVYLGIAPAHRGKGIGDLLMRQAAAVVSASPHARLSLAVDASNKPAMQLYWRHGLHALGRKLAMLRDLRAEGTR